jgi:hypothetical protein
VSSCLFIMITTDRSYSSLERGSGNKRSPKRRAKWSVQANRCFRNLVSVKDISTNRDFHNERDYRNRI